MFNNKKKANYKGKKCRQCFSYVRLSSRKCKFCGYKFNSSGEHLVSKIRQILHIDRAFKINSTKTPQKNENFFTLQEIEILIKLDNITIPMFLTLDNITMLDEMSLLELGKMLTKIDGHSLMIR